MTHTLEAYNNVHIIYEDVLKANLKEILGDNDWHAAANLPYYITTPILLYLIQSELPISLFVFMMQKGSGGSYFGEGRVEGLWCAYLGGTI